MYVVGGGHQHQVHRLVRQQVLQALVDVDIPGEGVLPPLRLDVPDPGHRQAVDPLDQIVMPARHAAEAGHCQCMLHYSWSSPYAQNISPRSS